MKILFEFFKKTMATNLMVEAGSAPSNEVKLSTLSPGNKEVEEHKLRPRRLLQAGNIGKSMH